jgi:RNA polymerase sigma-70 factor (ECF subfamily)
LSDAAGQPPSDAAFHEHVWPLRAVVLRVARLLVRDDAEADDLAQETLVRAYRGIGRFTPGTDARAWLLTILRNVRIDRLRSRATAAGRTTSLDALAYEPAAADAGDGPDGSADADAAWEDPRRVMNAFSDAQVIAALKRLPEEIRLTLLLVDVEQLDHADAASILKVPVGTIKSRAHRGRAMLRGALLPLAKELRMVRE